MGSGLGLTTLSPFLLADGSGPPRQPTTVRLGADEAAFTVHFECADDDAWGTYARRDDPLYMEECVEVFISAGVEDPAVYYEFEVSPHAVLADARVHNPTGKREDLSADFEWDCPGVTWSAEIDGTARLWRAELRIPWLGLDTSSGSLWRVNFLRIDRPRDGRSAEFSCWSPTLTSPPNFHVPARFGALRRA